MEGWEKPKYSLQTSGKPPFPPNSPFIPTGKGGTGIVADGSRIGPEEGVWASRLLNISFLKFQVTQYSVHKSLKFAVGVEITNKGSILKGISGPTFSMS